MLFVLMQTGGSDVTPEKMASSPAILSALIAAAVSMLTALIAHFREIGREARRAKLADSATKQLAFIRDWLTAVELLTPDAIEDHRASARKQLDDIRRHYDEQLATLARRPLERYRWGIVTAIMITVTAGVAYVALSFQSTQHGSAPNSPTGLVRYLDTAGRVLLRLFDPTTLGWSALALALALLVVHRKRGTRTTRNDMFLVAAGALEVWLGVTLWAAFALTSPPALELLPSELLPYAGLVTLIILTSSGLRSLRQAWVGTSRSA
jgi:hypothetical protein